ncbi:MAG: PD40 domain-containing protein [Deltaproteobacteria bacterium]|nr:PD40 domain-containing protein [Deltaproteobacteria bacterium]
MVVRRTPRGPWLAAAIVVGSIVVWGLAGLGNPARVAAVDPELTWRTLTTRHFRLNYPTDLRPIARRVAAIAERTYRVLVPELGWVPRERTEIILTDDIDYAQGSATAVPYNRMRLFVSAPEDMSALGDTDDWLLTLVTHEYTHVLHIDNISGVPAIINAILGKIYAPNLIQPRWVLEGLAVYEESRHTGGGRLRSSVYDMWLRRAFLDGREVRLDQLSNNTGRWPYGHVPYLYGSKFVQWIADRFGHETWARVAREYGGAPIPWALNRAIRRATGRTFETLYDWFRRDMRARYRRQIAQIRARGLRQGVRRTDHGNDVATPRWLADGSILYAAAGPNRRGSIYRLRSGQGPDDEPEDVVRVASEAALSIAPGERRIVFHRNEVYRHLYVFNDLFVHDRVTGETERLTEGLRAREPDVSPDGRTVAFSAHRAGTSHLMLGDVHDPQRTRRTLVRSARFEQVYTPRWSPDGRHIAYSAWLAGGYRDVFVVDVTTGARRRITNDRAIDQQPSWSPDGRTLLFTSDRTGVANVYAYDVELRALRQVTNVEDGAYMPSLSPDGRTLAYVGYRNEGYDVYTMPYDGGRSLEAVPYVDHDRGERTPVRDGRHARARDEPYQPTRTLLPRNYELGLASDLWGSALTMAVAGSDIVGFHEYTLSLAISLNEGHIGFDSTYRYTRLVFPMSMRFGRSVGQTTGSVGGSIRTLTQEAWRGGVSFALPLSALLESHLLDAGYDLTYLRTLDSLGGPLDPNTRPPQLPEDGWFVGVHASWGYSNVERYAESISANRGRNIGIRLSLAHPVLGSSFRVTTASYYYREFVPMPVRGHVLAVGLEGGISAGDAGRRGVFAVGGFEQVALLQALQDQIYAPSTALRGYPPGFRAGTRYQLLNVEYRFPILQIDRGLSTFPVFIDRVYGGAFVDYGNAFFGDFVPGDLVLGAGAELFLEMTLGYSLYYSLRFGLARGFMDGGETQGYFVLGTPF